ncbi:mitochondrial cytochrome c oxidase assembly protein/Cu2+ chaperone COX17 [Hyaloraphidium curvatum]|nr:mitochondrial cytochrome c oxidase assembly protein/Cu2+ chaperone COX17 [Hyaloraphidium curvatum]
MSVARTDSPPADLPSGGTCELPRKSASGEAKEPAKAECKSCVACYETRVARDECTMSVPDFEDVEMACKDLIEAHVKCMRDMGFNI